MAMKCATNVNVKGGPNWALQAYVVFIYANSGNMKDKSMFPWETERWGVDSVLSRGNNVCDKGGKKPPSSGKEHELLETRQGQRGWHSGVKGKRPTHRAQKIMLIILDINLRAMVKVFLKFEGKNTFWGKVRSDGETVLYWHISLMKWEREVNKK